MRKIILSFSFEWYEQLKSGDKIYEHRKRFCKEPVEAYIYWIAIWTIGCDC